MRIFVAVGLALFSILLGVRLLAVGIPEMQYKPLLLETEYLYSNDPAIRARSLSSPSRRYELTAYIQKLELATLIDPLQSNIWRFLGFLYFVQGTTQPAGSQQSVASFQKANELFRKAISLNSYHYLSLENLIVVKARLGEFDQEMVVLLDRALFLFPREYELNLNILKSLLPYFADQSPEIGSRVHQLFLQTIALSPIRNGKELKKFSRQTKGCNTAKGEVEINSKWSGKICQILSSRKEWGR